MSKTLTVKSRYVSTYDTLEISPNATIKSDGGRLKCIYDSEAKEREYIVNSFPIDDGEVEVPTDSIIAAVNASKLVVLVPKDQYE